MISTLCCVTTADNAGWHNVFLPTNCHPDHQHWGSETLRQWPVIIDHIKCRKWVESSFLQLLSSAYIYSGNTESHSTWISFMKTLKNIGSPKEPWNVPEVSLKDVQSNHTSRVEFYHSWKLWTMQCGTPWGALKCAKNILDTGKRHCA